MRCSGFRIVVGLTTGLVRRDEFAGEGLRGDADLGLAAFGEVAAVAGLPFVLGFDDGFTKGAKGETIVAGATIV